MDNDNTPLLSDLPGKAPSLTLDLPPQSGENPAMPHHLRMPSHSLENYGEELTPSPQRADTESLPADDMTAEERMEFEALFFSDLPLPTGPASGPIPPLDVIDAQSKSVSKPSSNGQISQPAGIYPSNALHSPPVKAVAPSKFYGPIVEPRQTHHAPLPTPPPGGPSVPRGTSDRRSSRDEQHHQQQGSKSGTPGSQTVGSITAPTSSKRPSSAIDDVAAPAPKKSKKSHKKKVVVEADGEKASLPKPIVKPKVKSKKVVTIVPSPAPEKSVQSTAQTSPADTPAGSPGKTGHVPGSKRERRKKEMTERLERLDQDFADNRERIYDYRMSEFQRHTRRVLSGDDQEFQDLTLVLQQDRKREVLDAQLFRNYQLEGVAILCGEEYEIACKDFETNREAMKHQMLAYIEEKKRKIRDLRTNVDIMDLIAEVSTKEQMSNRKATRAAAAAKLPHDEPKESGRRRMNNNNHLPGIHVQVPNDVANADLALIRKARGTPYHRKKP
ncbi:hypothetical protein HKX48_005675 [Thoreauomyces humboldtii]|nr:hypothetical protein HKX48_005675 [Thoreauomyces humboldtii]